MGAAPNRVGPPVIAPIYALFTIGRGLDSYGHCTVPIAKRCSYEELDADQPVGGWTILKNAPLGSIRAAIRPNGESSMLPITLPPCLITERHCFVSVGYREVGDPLRVKLAPRGINLHDAAEHLLSMLEHVILHASRHRICGGAKQLPCRNHAPVLHLVHTARTRSSNPAHR